MARIQIVVYGSRHRLVLRVDHPGTSKTSLGWNRRDNHCDWLLGRHYRATPLDDCHVHDGALLHDYCLLAQQRAHEEANRIMTRRMASVRQRVTPLLNQIADGRAPTPELRGQAYLLEAELRDEIRAPFFTGTSIVTSAHAARRRGTEVILLDDSGDNATIDDQARVNAVNYVTKLLDLTQSTRVVIRLNPPRRPALLTIVTDDTRYQLDRQGALMIQNDS